MDNIQFLKAVTFSYKVYFNHIIFHLSTNEKILVYLCFTNYTMADLNLPSLASLASITSDTMVLKQLFDLWTTSFSRKDSYSIIFKNIVSSSFNMLGIFIIQYHFKQFFYPVQLKIYKLDRLISNSI